MNLPLTDAELMEKRKTLEDWQPPQVFRNTTEALCKRCCSAEYFNQPRLKCLHDAYVLAEFIGLHQVDSVCLAKESDQWPDGFVKVGGEQHNVEVTSTHAGRRLGDEYRTVCTPTLDHVEDWEERANAIPCFLEEAIAAKIRKYGGLCNSCWLVVDLNMNDSGIRHHETEKAILEIKARHVAHFEAISVIWKRQLY